MIGENPESDVAQLVQRELGSLPETEHTQEVDPVAKVRELLEITQDQAEHLVYESKRLYIDRMRERFSNLRVAERLKRTNPFLLRIRAAKTVEDWAALQVQSALYASEEEAVGHLLETIAMICFPGGRTPRYTDDFDLESPGPNGEVYGYQIKMSWDCMPMSSRKNLSNTIRNVRERYLEEDVEFVGFFAPCYGKATTTKVPGQEYISLASREFWERVGNGKKDFDVYVGEVCALLCAEFREEVMDTLVPELIRSLTNAAQHEIGDSAGRLDYTRLFRRINR
ncbi:PmeII family type II restriction endonuclease [Nocardia flavorosea]|uniref:PmeII family type II restriction endonuclease n=1 Tax=Nocardia flavorosea TaxID=53429 RepID=UPI0024578F6C|nr:PmeII family type II restriction endonuclease [Nocardia flavorosea]